MQGPLPSEDEAALDESFRTVQPIDMTVAAKVLKEAKQILDLHGVNFALVSGTCLGAVRDKVLMPWDDDVDLGSIIGLHGFNEDSLEEIGTTFQDNGFIARLDHYGPNPII